MISSYVGENPHLNSIPSGELEVDLVPQGTLAERSEPVVQVSLILPQLSGNRHRRRKEIRDFNGTKAVLETSLTADVAFVKAWKGDRHGNLIFKTTAPISTHDGNGQKVTIAEVEELVDAGELDLTKSTPLDICSTDFRFQLWPIERVTSTSPKPSNGNQHDFKQNDIVRRVAQELQDGFYVNLGIGYPLRLPTTSPKAWRWFFTLMVFLGSALSYEAKKIRISSVTQTVTTLAGSSFFSMRLICND